MSTQFTSRLEGDFEAGQRLQGEQGRLVRGPLGRPRQAQGSGHGAPRRRNRRRARRARRVGTALTTVPPAVTVHKTLARILDAKRPSSTRRGHRLGDRRGAGVRHAAQGRLRRPPVGAGFGPRHLQPAPFGLGRPGRRQQVHAAEDDRAGFEVLDSPLSEFGVLGFEYGYALADPKTLVLWEAQFGDFANGAQVMIDQFIASGEAKWLRANGLVMLLPHGFEGQGPEHSSARLERFLQLCAEDNMQVANCTTPANYFHVLRRQMLRDFRKPLIIMTPKSLLRAKRAVSTLADIGPRERASIAASTTSTRSPDEQVRRLILCSGKVYYDLLEAREKAARDDIYILRVEQLYPFPADVIAEYAARFTALEDGGLVPGGAAQCGCLALRRPADRGRARPSRDLCRAGCRGGDRDRAGQAPQCRTGQADRRGARRSPVRGPRSDPRRPEVDAERRRTLHTSNGTSWPPTSPSRRSANRSPRRPSANGSRRPATRSRPTSRSSAWRPTRSRSRCRRRSRARWASSSSKVGDTVTIGATIARIEAGAGAPAKAAAPTPAVVKDAAPQAPRPRPPAAAASDVKIDDAPKADAPATPHRRRCCPGRRPPAARRRPRRYDADGARRAPPARRP